MRPVVKEDSDFRSSKPTDMVYSLTEGKGHIVNMTADKDYNRQYPVEVKFDKVPYINYFTLDGKALTEDVYPVLFKVPVTVMATEE